MSLSRLLLQNFRPALSQISVDKPPSSHCAQLTVVTRAAKTEGLTSTADQPLSSLHGLQGTTRPSTPRLLRCRHTPVFVRSTCKVPFRWLFDDFAIGQRQQHPGIRTTAVMGRRFQCNEHCCNEHCHRYQHRCRQCCPCPCYRCISVIITQAPSLWLKLNVKAH